MLISLDLRSLPCPGPVIELRRHLEAGERDLVLHVADDLALSNVTRFARGRGAEVEARPHSAGGHEVTVRAGAASPAPASEAPIACAPVSGPRVLQLAASTMGQGDEDLGALLLRGFLKTLLGVAPLPDRIVCYNGGVRLCCEGSTSLGELRALEARGVEILACGTCLNFYGLSGALAVGRVTDMLEIASILAAAGHVTRP